MISIIIPMYNAEKTIIQALEGLSTQIRNDFEVIIVDDGSVDKSAKLVTEFKKQSKLNIKLINQSNSGPAKARNVGVEHSSGCIIIFIDSDCIPPMNWVKEMVKPLNRNIVGCNCGYKVKNKEYLISRYIDYEIEKRHERLRGTNIDTIGSYAASYFKDIFTKVGGFSTEYPIASGEDFDFAFNLKALGYDLVFTDKTFVYHYHPDSLRTYLKQQFGRGYWRVKMYLRNKDKIFKGDSYTGHEAQTQFVLSNFVFLSIPFIIVFSPLFLLSFILLILSNLRLGLWMSKREMKFIFIAPLFASMRSLAGTLGVYMYFSRVIYQNLFKIYNSIRN